MLRRALLLLGGVAVIRNLINLADTFTNIQNRLRLVTDGVEELTDVTTDLLRISRDTRSNFEATAQVYARTALATKNLGISQKETLQFTESLNQAVILSGASAQEANAGLRQLSQGLASNRLSGDELRSVLEQLPLVADVISKSLGITRGELRKLGEQGEITADVVLKAFREARVELSENFANTIPTVGQSLEVLRTRLIATVGEIDKARGITDGLAKSIMTLSDNFDVVTDAVNIGIDSFQRFLLAGETTFILIFAGVPELLQNVLNSILAFVDNSTGAFKGMVSGTIAGFKKLSEIIGRLFSNLGLLASQALRGDLDAAAQIIQNNARLFLKSGQIIGDAFATGFEERVIPRVNFISEGTTGAALQKVLADFDAITTGAQNRRAVSAAGVGEEIFTLPLQEINEQATATEEIFRGLNQGIDIVKENMEDLANVASDLLVNAFKTAEDAFVEFTRTGKFDFTSLIDSIQRDLARLVFREAIAGISGGLGGLGGGGGGGGFGAFVGNLLGGAGNRANGGPVKAGQLIAGGGRDPELFVPESDGFITPVNTGQGAAGAAPMVTKPQINLTLINVKDMAEAETAVASSQDEEVILNVITDNKSLIKQVIS